MLPQDSVAPDFTLPDQFGIDHTLSYYQGQWVLLFFYPKDGTSGCTQEACALQETFEQFKTKNIVVFGINADSKRSHEAFAKKHNLQFPLLSDADKKVSKLYEAKGFLSIKRVSYLIDPEGTIAMAYEHVIPGYHAQEVLGDVNAFSR